MKTKIMFKHIDGILLLDKPINMTSNGALQRVKYLFQAKKAGHTGSLDPLATGMLPLCFGEATKFSQFLLESDKHYQVDIQLGVLTTTGDAEGEILSSVSATHIDLMAITAVLPDFRGKIQQIPPMFSALKHNGRPLYELARQGIEVERKPRFVTIHQLEVLSYDQDTSILRLDIHCTKGTYVRTLAEDLGNKLGCGAHVSGLRRITVTPYQGATLYTLVELEKLVADAGGEPAALLPTLLKLETAVNAFPQVTLSTSAAFYLRLGQPVMVPYLTGSGYVRLYSSDNQFLGVGEILDDGRVAPRRLLSPLKKVAKAV